MAATVEPWRKVALTWTDDLVRYRDRVPTSTTKNGASEAEPVEKAPAKASEEAKNAHEKPHEKGHDKGHDKVRQVR